MKKIASITKSATIGNSKQQESIEIESNEVSHPPHYNFGQFEVIEVIEDWSLNFNKGNAIKYIARAGKKKKEVIDEITDLKKAIFYLEREIYNLSR